ncbi:MAG: tetratricopeptide repeat protein [Chitinophagaceae bacterium]|nr:tetratricopeptide repeat protein [Chitinophagaceae bacterium]
MSFRKLVPALLLLLICSNMTLAQVAQQPAKNQNQPTYRILKTATTLMEAQQYEAAEEYFNKALQNAKASKNNYHLAQAYEGLGNLYSKTKQQTLAVESYDKAIKLYNSLGYTVIADVLKTLKKNVQGIGELYAGIEIGARGIKLSVIEVKLGNGENDYNLKLDTSINTDAAALSYQSEKETFDAITLLYGILRKRYQVPSSRTHIVISSGLKQDLDKYNKVEYFANIIRPKELDPQIKIGYVTVDEEAQLSFKGIVPQVNRLSADQLDVGSGNTKGGYLNAGRTFIPVTFPWGTKSFQRLVESKAQGNQSLEDFRLTAEKLIADSLRRSMVNHFLDKRDFKTRDIVYLSGGIVWSIASLMHPDQIRQNHVELSQQDIAAFRDQVYARYDDLIKPDLSKMNAEDAAVSLANIRRVVNTYDQKAMLSGAIWLDELVRQVNTINPNKKFIFPRFAYVGWISGYIIDKTSKQYTELAAN